MTNYDLIIIGGGLSGGMIAYWLSRYKPACRFLLVEKDNSFGGNHTWSFHENDFRWNHISDCLEALSEFDLRQWQSHEICFPGLKQFKKQRYFSMDSHSFDQGLRRQLKSDQFVCGVSAQYNSHQNIVELSNGQKVSAPIILRACGPEGYNLTEKIAYQKFLGLRVQTSRPHGLKHAILMDADLAQQGGFRFMYVLPYSSDTLLLEDTYYSTNTDLNEPILEKRIYEYSIQHGWDIQRVLGREKGCLPIPLSSKVQLLSKVFSSQGGSTRPLLLEVGVSGGLFHATTGYSLTEAVRFSQWFCRHFELPLEELRYQIYAYQNEFQDRSRFYARLNNMLFCAGQPGLRYMILRGFYGLDDELVARFYALRLSYMDKLRLLWNGRSLVPLFEGLKAFLRLAEVKHDEQLSSSFKT